MAAPSTIYSLLDIVRANASTEYQARVPEAVQTSITAVGNPILERLDFMNEFVHGLVGRIGLTIVRQRTFNNPLSVLKKGKQILGVDIQDLILNVASDQGFDGKGDKLLTRTIPDVKVIYHRRNRKSQYPSTISREQLADAFVDVTTMEKFLGDIINMLYSGDNIDEFLLTKNTFASAITAGNIVPISVDDISATGAVKKLAKAIINTAKFMQFPSTKWNAYNLNRPDSDTGKPLTTWCPLENQILIIRADIMTEIDVEELATAYNMDKVTFKTRVLEVDNFGGATNCYAILADEAWVEVRDNLYSTEEFYNPQGMYWNYWLNHWQTYSLSTFGNAVAFLCGSEAISTDATTLTFNSSATQTITPTVTPTNATVTWISTDEAIATVASTGVVTPVANGTCYICAINGDAIANVKVTVNIAG
jgi:hypothetical protein